MKRLLPALAIVAACAALDAQAAAGDNPPPGLLAKIQIATQAVQDPPKREFKDLKKFVSENAQAVEPQSGQAQGGASGGGTGPKAGDSGNDR